MSDADMIGWSLLPVHVDSDHRALIYEHHRWPLSVASRVPQTRVVSFLIDESFLRFECMWNCIQSPKARMRVQSIVVYYTWRRMVLLSNLVNVIS